MTLPRIPFDLSTIDLDQVNPWHIKDGKWGGWGPAYWKFAHEHGFAKGDVIEWRHVEGQRRWWRVWVDVDQRWRKLTEEETNRLPALGERHNVTFSTIPGFPIKKTKRSAEVLAALLEQPILQVIQQAPVMKDVFDKNPLDTSPQDK